MHLPVAEAALRAGFAVMSDKPATLDVAQALELADIIKDTGLNYGLTHTYVGYPMVREARAQVVSGVLGKIRKVLVEYPQGWLATAPEQDNKQAACRLPCKYKYSSSQKYNVAMIRGSPCSTYAT